MSQPEGIGSRKVDNGDGQQTKPPSVCKEVPRFDSNKCKVEKFLTGVNYHSPGEADEGIDGEEEALFLVWLQPENQQPEVEGSLTQPVR